jgi:hypothetical protein
MWSTRARAVSPTLWSSTTRSGTQANEIHRNDVKVAGNPKRMSDMYLQVKTIFVKESKKYKAAFAHFLCWRVKEPAEKEPDGLRDGISDCRPKGSIL